MAQRTIVEFLDDIDGGPAQGTVPFSLDGTNYEIDLNPDHERELRAALDRYIKAGRRVQVTNPIGGSVPRSMRRSRDAATAAATDGASTQEIRNWAKGQGIQINERGRIPTSITSQFLAAKRSGTATADATPAVTPAAPSATFSEDFTKGAAAAGVEISAPAVQDTPSDTETPAEAPAEASTDGAAGGAEKRATAATARKPRKSRAARGADQATKDQETAGK